MSRAMELAKGHGNVLVSGAQVAFNRWQLDEYYAAAKADGLRQAAEIAERNMHLAIRDALLELIPK